MARLRCVAPPEASERPGLLRSLGPVSRRALGPDGRLARDWFAVVTQDRGRVLQPAVGASGAPGVVHAQQTHLKCLVLVASDQQLARSCTHTSHQSSASRLPQSELQLSAGTWCAEHPPQCGLRIVEGERSIVGGNIGAAEKLVQRRSGHSAPLQAVRRLAKVQTMHHISSVVPSLKVAMWCARPTQQPERGGRVSRASRRVRGGVRVGVEVEG